MHLWNKLKPNIMLDIKQALESTFYIVEQCAFNPVYGTTCVVTHVHKKVRSKQVYFHNWLRGPARVGASHKMFISLSVQIDKSHLFVSSSMLGHASGFACICVSIVFG